MRFCHCAITEHFRRYLLGKKKIQNLISEISDVDSLMFVSVRQGHPAAREGVREDSGYHLRSGGRDFRSAGGGWTEVEHPVLQLSLSP